MPNTMSLGNLAELQASAALQMTVDNKQLFESAGIYSVITSLQDMASQSMPADSFGFYQQVMTPKWLCNATKPPLMMTGAAPTQAVAPLGTWEEPDNLSKGSVVVRGVVIGGKKAAAARAKAAPAPVQAKAATAAAPVKAKAATAAAPVKAEAAPAPAPVQAKAATAAAPAKAKAATAAAPAKAKQPAGRRLLA